MHFLFFFFFFTFHSELFCFMYFLLCLPCWIELDVSRRKKKEKNITNHKSVQIGGNNITFGIVIHRCKMIAFVFIQLDVAQTSATQNIKYTIILVWILWRIIYIYMSMCVKKWCAVAKPCRTMYARCVYMIFCCIQLLHIVMFFISKNVPFIYTQS